LLRYVAYFDIHHFFRICFRYFRLFSDYQRYFLLFWKFTDFGNFLSFNHIPGQFSATAYITGIIHKRERKTPWKRYYQYMHFMIQRKHLTSGGGHETLYKVYTESMWIQYLWNKFAFCEILYSHSIIQFQVYMCVWIVHQRC
jgi:hypothetical protein